MCTYPVPVSTLCAVTGAEAENLKHPDWRMKLSDIVNNTLPAVAVDAP